VHIARVETLPTTRFVWKKQQQQQSRPCIAAATPTAGLQSLTNSMQTLFNNMLRTQRHQSLSEPLGIFWKLYQSRLTA